MLLDGPDDESDNEGGDLRDAAGHNKSNQSESDESELSESDEGATVAEFQGSHNHQEQEIPVLISIHGCIVICHIMYCM